MKHNYFFFQVYYKKNKCVLPLFSSNYYKPLRPVLEMYSGCDNGWDFVHVIQVRHVLLHWTKHWAQHTAIPKCLIAGLGPGEIVVNFLQIVSTLNA